MSQRVLHLLSQRPGWTGSGVALDAISRAADRAGWQQCALVGTPHTEPAPTIGTLDSTRIHSIVFEGNGIPFPIPGMSDVMPYPSTRFSELSADQIDLYKRTWGRRVAKLVEQFRPHVIHTHHVWLLSSIVKEVAPRTPVVTHCHGTGFRQMSLCPHLADEVAQGCLRNDAFVVLHQGHADFLQKRIGVSNARIRVTGNGFRSEVFHARDRKELAHPVVTYAGKLCEAKGVPWLLDAFARLSKKMPHLTLNVAGSGAGREADAIRRRIQSMRKVELHGQLDQAQLANLFRKSSVFVLPSFYEGLPLVLVEAAACGCRLVSTALPGVVEQLACELKGAMELVPLPRMETTDRPVLADLPKFVDNLASALTTSLVKPPAEKLDQLVSGMTWDAVFSRIENLWRELISCGSV